MGMDQGKLQVIKELMDSLVGEMEPSHDDFDSRLGKPKVDMMAIKGQMPMDSDDDSGDDKMSMMGMGDDDQDPDQDGDMDSMFGGSPEDKLKDRIMKLRG